VIRHLPLVALLLIVHTAPLAAQEPVPVPDAPPPDTLVVPEEPAGAVKVEFTGIDPRTAFIRSLVLPGWGQASVGSPTRGAVYFGMEVGSLWMLQKASTRLRQARERDDLLRSVGLLGPTDRSEVTASRRREREDWLTLAIFTLFFSAADAYVAAWLQDFDAEVGALPDPGGGFRLQVGVPIGGRP
jgi:hypothetical protein